jgi:formate hydrogenlyase subunit 3/multisubunit Na+/H+ antiporter MnhD subunit
MAEHVVMLLVLVPLATAVVNTLARRHSAWLSIVSGVVTIALAGWLIVLVGRHGMVDYVIGGWEPPLGIRLHADGVSALFTTMTAVVTTLIAVFGAGYFRAEADAHGDGESGEPSSAFWPLLMLTWAALNALFLSGDLFNLYVTLELLTFAAVAMIGLAGTVESLMAALRYLIIALAGSLFYLFGVALLFSDAGTVDWQLLQAGASPDPVTHIALALMTVGLLLKTAVFPLHFWLPAAHANAPAPVSALLSGVVLKASLYMLYRLWLYVYPAALEPAPADFIAVLGGCAVIWGSVQAIRQERLKLLLAYSSIAQIGYLFLVFAFPWTDSAELAWRGVIYLAISHGVAKGAAFMAAGAIAHAAGTDHISKLGGIALRVPMPAFAFALAGVSLIGLPPSGGFLGKWMVLNASLAEENLAVTLVLITGGLLAAVYVFRVLSVVCRSVDATVEHAPSAVLRWTPLVLAVLSVVLGFTAMYPIELLEIGTPFADGGFAR